MSGVLKAKNSAEEIEEEEIEMDKQENYLALNDADKKTADTVI